MGFSKKKVYGSYKILTCTFCAATATHKNETGLEVCRNHLKSSLEEIKCTCGSWLEQKSGKFGAYFNCINCGNINFKRGLEIKEITMKDKEIISEKPKEKEAFKQRKEITITSDDVEYFD